MTPARCLTEKWSAPKKAGGSCQRTIHIGAMIETPAAAWLADQIAAKVDFLSIGGNDLAQFYFAADRDSERVQRRYDPMNPGFLSFLADDGSKSLKTPKRPCHIAASKLLTRLQRRQH